MQAECTALLFDGAVRTYRIAAVAEERGRLTPVDLAAIGFAPVRAFVIEAPDGETRGGHGHRSGRQLLLRISGEVEIDLALGEAHQVVRLDATDNAVLIEAPVWSRQTYRGPDARLLVFSDTPYDPNSYIDEP